jgi:hypothetical protein
MSVKTPEMPSAEAANQIAEQAKQLEAEVAKIQPMTGDFVVYIVQMAQTVRRGLEVHAQNYDSVLHSYNRLAKRNAKLTKELDELKQRLVIPEKDDDDEDDSRMFGTHIREAWHALTGR